MSIKRDPHAMLITSDTTSTVNPSCNYRSFVGDIAICEWENAHVDGFHHHIPWYNFHFLKMFSLHGPYIFIFPHFGHIFGTFPHLFSRPHRLGVASWARCWGVAGATFDGSKPDWGYNWYNYYDITMVYSYICCIWLYSYRDIYIWGLWYNNSYYDITNNN